MNLGVEDVKAIAHLARVNVEEEKLEGYVKSLANVLALAEQMDDVDTDGIEPMAHPLHATQTLRDDVVTESDQRKKFQAIAPAIQDELYLVPKVIE